MGANVAIVAGNDNKKLRASLRATNNFTRETSIHLGQNIATILGEEFEGAGSGHSTAAGVNGEGDPETLLVVEPMTSGLQSGADIHCAMSPQQKNFGKNLGTGFVLNR